MTLSSFRNEEVGVTLRTSTGIPYLVWWLNCLSRYQSDPRALSSSPRHESQPATASLRLLSRYNICSSLQVGHQYTTIQFIHNISALVCISVCIINTDWRQLEATKGLFGSHILITAYIENSHGRKSSRSGTEAEIMGNSHWLSPDGLLSLHSYTTQGHLSSDSTTHSVQSSPILISKQQCPTTYAHVNPMAVVPQLRFSLPEWH